ncbi:hypothetical protein [Streptomyces sp. NPDC003077]|uniref:hypothetical protein n=1 Tax=Streptomyces sp. NPDC003077 TaxID=3154443 RepID=UPI0033AFF64E
MTGWLLWVFVAIGVVLPVALRIRGYPADLRDLFVTPLIFVGIGALSLAKMDDLSPKDLAWATGGALLGLTLGVLRGCLTQVYEKEGVLWQRYRRKTLFLVLASLVVMVGFGFLAAGVGVHKDARPVHLNIGVSFLGEALAIAYRGWRTGIPFATENKSKPGRGREAGVRNTPGRLDTPGRRSTPGGPPGQGPPMPHPPPTDAYGTRAPAPRPGPDEQEREPGGTPGTRWLPPSGRPNLSVPAPRSNHPGFTWNKNPDEPEQQGGSGQP